MVSSETPPSTCSQVSTPCWSSSARARRILGRHEVEELLAAEARLDGHQQQHVELGQQVLVGLDRGGRLERHAGAGAVAADLAGQPDRRRGRLDVEGDRAAARLDVRHGVPVGVLDHQVRVERQVGGPGQRLDHRRAEGQVRDEVVVHHVDVHQSALPIRATSAPRSAKSAFRMLGVIWMPTGDDPRGSPPAGSASGSGSAGGSAPVPLVALGPLQQRREVEDVVVDVGVQVAELGEALAAP